MPLLLQASVVLLTPVLELIFLRWLLHSVVQYQIGFPGMTDFDFFVPGPISFFLLFYFLSTPKKASLSFNASRIHTHLFTFLPLLVVSLAYPFFKSHFIGGWWVLWVSLLIANFLSGICLFVPYAFFFERRRALAFIPATLLAFSIPLYLNFPDSFYRTFLQLTTTVLEPWVHVLMPNVNVYETPIHHFLVLAHPELTLRVGRGCGGMDSLFFFSIVFLVLAWVKSSWFSKSTWCAIYLGGIVYFFAVNLLRICILLGLGVGLRRYLGEETGTYILKNIAHAHMGWILYAGAMVVYFQSALWFFTKRSSEISLPKAEARAL